MESAARAVDARAAESIAWLLLALLLNDLAEELRVSLELFHNVLTITNHTFLFPLDRERFERVGAGGLHETFFQASKDLQDPLKPLLMLDYLNPTFSSATMATQYIAALASGVESMLVLLWGKHPSLKVQLHTYIDDSNTTSAILKMGSIILAFVRARRPGDFNILRVTHALYTSVPSENHHILADSTTCIAYPSKQSQEQQFLK